MQLVELSRSEHAGLRIREDLVEASAANQHLIPIVVSEFRKAATQYPIVFAKNPDTGRFGSYVLNGLNIAENLFWSGTQMDVAYVPLNVRRQPFYVGTANELCVDLDSPCLDGTGGKGIVNPDGSDSLYLTEILSVLNQLVAGQKTTERFIATALSLDLLAPLMLDIVLEDKTPLKVQGIYGVDEEKLRQLDGEEISRLWKSGWLDLIYSVLISMGQIYNLIRLKNQRISLSRAWHDNES